MMKSIYEKAIEYYGAEKQLVVSAEELAELIQALTKNLRGFDNLENISEEIADVEICLKYLYIIFGNDLIVDEYKKAKLQRLEERMGEDL